jgi:hypothetical protein
VPALSELVSELLSEVSDYKSVNLGEREAEFLARVGEGHNSSYKIFSYLKNTGHPMDYKNVNKRVRRLHELKLIKEIKTKGESLHNAKFFSLTSEGIFYLLTQRQPIPLQLLTEYKDNLILKVLLYPYFEENTIAMGVREYEEIAQYLRECSNMILTYNDYIRNLARHQLRKVAKEKIIEQLRYDLEWQAKSLAFRLLTRRTRRISDIITPFTWRQQNLNEILKRQPDFLDKPAPKASLLPIDKKFVPFAKNLGKEVEQAYTNLVESRKKYE